MPNAKKHVWPAHSVLHGPGNSGPDCGMGGDGRCMAYLPGIGKTGKSLPIAQAEDLIARGLAVDHPPQGVNE